MSNVQKNSKKKKMKKMLQYSINACCDAVDVMTHLKNIAPASCRIN